MQVPPLGQRPIDPHKLSLEKLQSDSHISDHAKVHELCRQFEAILVHQILAEAQKPVFASKYDEQSSSINGIYRDMVTKEMAQDISQDDSLGLAKILEVQLDRLNASKTAKAPPSTVAAASSHD